MVKGQRIQCLLDSGSQVSILPLSVFNRLKDAQFNGRLPWLTIKAANEGLIPYLGYFETNVVIEGQIIEDVGFLLVENDRMRIIGMNIIGKLQNESSSHRLGELVLKRRKISDRRVVENGVMGIGSDDSWLDRLVTIGDLGIEDKLRSVLKMREKAFAKRGDKLSKSRAGVHHIRTIDDVPVNSGYRRIPPGQLQQVKEHLDGLLKDGVIEPSESNYCSPMVIVKKKSGDIRLCIDYRKLNSKTIRDTYPLRRVDDLLDIVAGKRYYTSLDLKSAYNQIPVVSEDQHKTAFISPLGLYQFVRMPFGLINAPATFQRIMVNLFRESSFKNIICYLDDIVIFSDNVDQHLDTIERVLSRLEDVGLKLNIEKCNFFSSEILFLGHTVSIRGVETDSDKIKAVRDWPVPKSLREVRTLLGFFSYYQKFVKGFSKIVSPLNKLIVEVNMREGKPVSRRRSKGVMVEWNSECDQAFSTLKTALCSSPVLVVPNWDNGFIVETDASASGLGAVLSQLVGHEKRVVAYASRSLRRGEQNKANFSSKKLELLAVVWAITEKFSYYLRGSKCVVIIDILPIMERDNLVLEQSKDMVIKNALVVAGKNDYVGRLVIKEGVLFEKREGHNDRLMVPRSLVIDVV